MTGERPGGATSADGLVRCAWATSASDYVAYHDREWGRELHGDREMFERLSLEAFQSGLSWLTILRKREAFRAAFADFDIDTVAGYDRGDVDRLLADTGIVRNRAKIEATVANARVLTGLGGSFSDLVWSFAPAHHPVPATAEDVPATTAESTALARELRRRGLRFVGPTTAYALMQATGMVDDHVADCWVRTRAGVPRTGSGACSGRDAQSDRDRGDGPGRRGRGADAGPAGTPRR